MAQQPETAAKELVITRILNAPRELVFTVWTQAEHLAKWWGPKGMAITVKKLDVRPGGLFLYSMALPDGQAMWGCFNYQEVTPPERLVFTSSFSNEQGDITRAPFSTLFPLEIHNTLVLTETTGKTTLTLTGRPLNATEEETAFFAAMHANMQQGFAGTFEQLGAYLDEVVESE